MQNPVGINGDREYPNDITWPNDNDGDRGPAPFRLGAEPRKHVATH
jgi:hypothetical protein